MSTVQTIIYRYRKGQIHFNMNKPSKTPWNKKVTEDMIRFVNSLVI